MRRETRGEVGNLLIGLVVFGIVVEAGGTRTVGAQGIPGVTDVGKAADPPVAQPKDSPKAVPAPTKDNPEATVATAAGPIKTDQPVNDHGVEEALKDLLPKYPGVRSIVPTVIQGVVELDGHVQDDDVRDQMTRVAMQVEGVRMVVNRLKTDAQTLTSRELVMKKLAESWEFVSQRWLIAILALVIVLVFSTLARLFHRHAETLLAPFVTNMLLRSVLGSLIGSALLVAGVLLGLQVLNLTQAVLSILGLAGVIGLAVGFAFRDIAENFIASVLLGWRRPFRLGDYVTVAGHAGVVKSLNTRATVLVTLEGKHVRIPNNVIYKEILVNSSASSSTRGSFDVIIPYEVSTALAMDAMTQALREVDGVLPNPPARVLVESLELNGIRLRAYYWLPVVGVDGFNLHSEARLKAKVALQKAGIMPPPTNVVVSVLGKVPIERDGRDDASRDVVGPRVVVTRAQAEANLRRDTFAADHATSTLTPDSPTPMERVLEQPETRVSEEGANLLLKEKRTQESQ
ncbi:MAG: mechanosensitive ion channel domain-containing protein [Isosphaeraceae bacterium]